MPAEGIHLTALREALASTRTDAAIRRRVARRDDAARLGALLVDLPYFHRYRGEVIRYLVGLPARSSPWGARLHEGGAIGLLDALLHIAREGGDDTAAAIALGLASHLAIDRALHPLINALARRFPVGRDHGTAHREVEKFQSICFHEEYYGADLMGTPAITHHLAIQLAAQLADARIGGPVLAAYARAFAEAPTRAELAGFGRGYRAHTRLLGSPLGKRIAPEADKEAARPRYLRGGWGNFAPTLEAAIAASSAVINAAGAVLEASASDQAAAFAALARVLPPGTIDPDGADIDLERPFTVALPVGEIAA